MHVNLRKAERLIVRCGLLACLLTVSSGATDISDSSVISIGHKASIHSEVLNKSIELSIHVPDSYGEPGSGYLVLFTFQTHFEQVAGAVKSLYDYHIIPEMIVVRVDNYEFGYLTPSIIERNPNSGRANDFLSFFEKDLFPYIDSTYPTSPYRIVFSNSWGGMFAAYSILAKPEIFNAAVASIPWVIYDGDARYMISHARRFLDESKFRANYLFMTMDNEEELLPALEEFVDIIRANPRDGLKWSYRHWPEEDHTSTPYRSINDGLREIFASWSNIPPGVTAGGLEAVKEYEKSLAGRFGFCIGLSSQAVRRAAQELQGQEQFERAVALYQYCIEKDPRNPMGYVSLGRAYEAQNRLDLARDAYADAYRIAVETSHPQVKWVKNFLDAANDKITEEK